MPSRTVRDQTIVALLRGVNVGGNHRLPMAILRQVASDLGCRRVESYVQSGNLVLATRRSPEALASALEQGIVNQFGFAVDVVVRSAEAWRFYAAGSPFPDAERERPQLLHLAVAKRKPKSDALDALGPYVTHGERLSLHSDALWIDFAGGVARSKLTSAVLDRAVGSTVTLRNWRTVQRLTEMAVKVDPAAAR